MATIAQIKTDNNTNIRTQTAPGSITKTIDANMRDVVADELRDRGVIRVATTGSLSTTSNTNTKLVLVSGVGLFEALNSGASPDNDTTFASADSGWLWNKIADASSKRIKFNLVANGTYVLPAGYSIYKIKVKPGAALTVKIGTTAAGDELMFEEALSSSVWKTVNVDVDAEGGTVTIYFTGTSSSTDIIIYIEKL